MEYPREVFFDLTSEPEMIARITIYKIKKNYNSEIDLIFKESKKIFYHVGSLFGFDEEEDCLGESTQTLSFFLMQKKNK